MFSCYDSLSLWCVEGDMLGIVPVTFNRDPSAISSDFPKGRKWPSSYDCVTLSGGAIINHISCVMFLKSDTKKIQISMHFLNFKTVIVIYLLTSYFMSYELTK